MRNMPDVAAPLLVSLVERGWQAVRDCSLDAQRDGVHVLHLVKGWLDPAVRAMSPPQPRIRLLSMPRDLFWPWAWMMATGCWASGRLRAILVDNERAQQRLRSWAHLARTPIWLVQPGPKGYELLAGADRLDRAPWHACASR